MKPKVYRHHGLAYRSLKGYKYQLIETFSVNLSKYTKAFNGLPSINTGWYSIRSGILTLYRGYASDGPSGPTFDTKNFMRGAFSHDGLYQALRDKKLPKHLRKAADIVLRKMCREDGMSAIRAWWVYHAVRMFGAKSAKW